MQLILRIFSWISSLLLTISHPLFWYWNRKPTPKLPPTNNNLLQLSACELAKKIRLRQISSETVITAYIERIKQVNPLINAVVDERYEDAIREAKNCDKMLESGEISIEQITRDKPLFGIPFTVKESCAYKGLSHTGCSMVRRGIKASEDSLAVRIMKKSGAIGLCVTNTPELCTTFESTNLVYGTTANPYDGRRSAGGSSGGEGALIGAGASLIGVASDTAGSIRVPSLFNGIFGHKPTPGIVPVRGHIPMANNAHFQKYLVVGPMARYAEDLFLAFKVMSVDFKGNLGLDEPVDVSKLNVFYIEDVGLNFGITPINSDVRRAIRTAVEYFEELGAKVSKPEVDEVTDTCEIAISKFLNMEDKPAILIHPNDKKEHVNSSIELLKSLVGLSQYSTPAILMSIFQDMNGLVALSDVPKYLKKSEELKIKLLKLLGDDGVFFYPTFVSAAPLLGQSIFQSTAGMYSLLSNVLGLPSTQVPMGLNGDGLPIGFQVLAAPYQDRLCLAVAKELEKAFGGWIPPTTS